MIANCEGCKYDFEAACYYEKKGFHVASVVDRPTIGEKGHYHVLMVDDEGTIWVGF